MSGEDAAREQEILKENIQLRRLQRAVDGLCREIAHGITDERFNERYAEVRSLAEHLFPDKMELFDMIYGSRLRRFRELFSGEPLKFRE